MRTTVLFAFFAFALVMMTSFVDASDLLNNKLEKRNKKTTTTTTTEAPTTTTTAGPTSTSTRPTVSECGYVQKCGVTCCQGMQHCCPNDPTKCCNPIIP